MALEVLGAGFGRTGTKSLKDALEILGFVRCHHMLEVGQLKDSPKMWVDAVEGRPDWETIFDGYKAAVDWPVCTFWRELSEYYPKAKIILSKRDSESWFKSTQNTIFSPQTEQRIRASDRSEMLEKVVWSTFDQRIHDKEHCIRIYEAHNAEVMRTIPKERLLVFEAAHGWEPLCTFLGVPVPAAAFPFVNTSEQFAERLKSRPPD